MDLLRIRGLINSGKSIFELPLRVAYYARVSTDKDEQMNSLENQIQYYEEYISGIENWSLAGAYIDEGLSGTSVDKRESFLRMISDAGQELFDLIITKEISRFSRNTLDSIKYTQKLLSYGVGVFFQYDNINTLCADSELRLTIMSSIAQDEVRKLSERVKFGFRRSIENGKVLGQTNIMGYDKKDGILTINEAEAQIVRRVFEEYARGECGLRRIARGLEKDGIVDSKGKMISFGTLRSILTNPKYKGYYCGGKYATLDYRTHKCVKLDQSEWVQYKDERIPGIVSEALWDEANRLLRERGERLKERGGAFQSRYPYSGKLFCAEHGVSYHRHVYKNSQSDREVWNCKLYRLKGKVDGCDSPTIYTSELNAVMSDVYRRIYDNREALIQDLLNVYASLEDVRDYKKERMNIERDIADIHVKKDKLLELSIEGYLEKAEFARRNQGFNQKLSVLADELGKLEREERLSQSSKRASEEIRRALEKEWPRDGTYDSAFSAIILDRIILHKTGERNRVKMEILLKFNMGFAAEYSKTTNCISLNEIGISQAQVSRLEKSALNHMKKYV